LPKSKFAGGSEKEIPQVSFRSSNIGISFGMTLMPGLVFFDIFTLDTQNDFVRKYIYINNKKGEKYET
jgi:hypothetical protein